MSISRLLDLLSKNSAAGLVKSGATAKMSWVVVGLGRTAAEDSTWQMVEAVIDGLPLNEQQKVFLKYLVHLADEYSTCIAEAGGQPDKAAIKLLMKKGVHTGQLFASLTESEALELISALGEFAVNLPDRLKMARLGGIYGVVSAVGLTINDAITVGNNSTYLQRKYYEAWRSGAIPRWLL
jgi:hypothetical protein